MILPVEIDGKNYYQTNPNIMEYWDKKEDDDFTSWNYTCFKTKELFWGKIILS